MKGILSDLLRGTGGPSACTRDKDDLCENRKLFGERIPGSYAERMIVRADLCLPLPDGLSSADAAASPVALGTAWHALVPRGGLQVGKRC